MFNLLPLCEYFIELHHPSVQLVLDANAENTICTNTQCFADLDALVPMQSPPTQAHMLYWMAMLASLIAILLHATIPVTPSQKPSDFGMLPPPAPEN